MVWCAPGSSNVGPLSSNHGIGQFDKGFGRYLRVIGFYPLSAVPKDFLALQKAVVATDPSKPRPWPIEAFLGAHPVALKFVQESQVIPASYGTTGYFSNNAFIFVNKDGVKRAGRYKTLPVAGQHNLSDAQAKTKSANFLADDLRARLKTGPVKFRLVVQLANPEDPTNDGSLVWPEDRRTVDVGTLSITSVVADSDAAQKALVLFPTT